MDLHSLIIVSAEEEIRTPIPFRALPPQSSASTSFATSAAQETLQLFNEAKIQFSTNVPIIPFLIQF
jgi:hypothetical protein